jgi:hypothetical protein
MKIVVFILITCGLYFLLRQATFFSHIGLVHLFGGFGWDVTGNREKFDRVKRALKIARMTAAWLLSLGAAWWVVSTRLPGIH